LKKNAVGDVKSGQWRHGPVLKFQTVGVEDFLFTVQDRNAYKLFQRKG
jgi:hypothetical protein